MRRNLASVALAVVVMTVVLAGCEGKLSDGEVVSPPPTENNQLKENIVPFTFTLDQFIENVDRNLDLIYCLELSGHETGDGPLNEQISCRSFRYGGDASYYVYYGTEDLTVYGVRYILSTEGLTSADETLSKGLLAATVGLVEADQYKELAAELMLNDFYTEHDQSVTGSRSEIHYTVAEDQAELSVLPTESTFLMEMPPERHAEFDLTMDEYIGFLDKALDGEGRTLLSSIAPVEGSGEDGQEYRYYSYSDGVAIQLFHNDGSNQITDIQYLVTVDKLSDDDLNAFGLMNANTIAGMEPDRKYEIDEKLGMSNWTEDALEVATGDRCTFLYSVDDTFILFSVSPK